jgi:hypothetical protein
LDLGAQAGGDIQPSVFFRLEIENTTNQNIDHFKLKFQGDGSLQAYSNTRLSDKTTIYPGSKIDFHIKVSPVRIPYNFLTLGISYWKSKKTINGFQTDERYWDNIVGSRYLPTFFH